MLRILEFIPTKWKAFEVVGFGRILETGLGKHSAGGRETRGDTAVIFQTSVHSLDQQQGGDGERWKGLESSYLGSRFSGTCDSLGVGATRVIHWASATGAVAGFRVKWYAPFGHAESENFLVVQTEMINKLLEIQHWPRTQVIWALKPLCPHKRFPCFIMQKLPPKNFLYGLWLLP